MDAPGRDVVSCAMSTGYSREQRLGLEKAVKEKAELACPECGGRMSQQAVVPAPNVPYVRHRVWVMCLQCRRSASLDT
jgi:hypothetical protein